jgi:hypothetical protein
VKGARIFPTEAGKKAALRMEHPKGLAVCKQGSRTVFEVRYSGPAALAAAAELYAPDGAFVVAPHDLFPALLNSAGQPLKIGGATVQDSTFTNCNIGVRVFSDGRFVLGS